jgi:hypothetical protein
VKDRLSKSDKISATLSVLALLGSSVALYFQFFYSSEKLEFAVANVSGAYDDLEITGAFVNGGNKVALVSVVQVVAVTYDRKTPTLHVLSDPNLAKIFPAIVKPGELFTFRSEVRSAGKDARAALEGSGGLSSEGKGVVKIGVLVEALDSEGQHYGALIVPISADVGPLGLIFANASYKPESVFVKKLSKAYSTK